MGGQLPWTRNEQREESPKRAKMRTRFHGRNEGVSVRLENPNGKKQSDRVDL